MFKNCTCIEDVKRTFRELAKKLHPDNGGDVAQFQKMKIEYEKAFNRFKNIHKAANGEYYKKETKEAAADFADVIEKVINLDGINIEVCGSWVWVTGKKTKEHKEAIKAAGYHWSQNKKAWYYHEGVYKKWHGKKQFSMAEIRAKYGSQNVKEDSVA